MKHLQQPTSRFLVLDIPKKNMYIISDDDEIQKRIPSKTLVMNILISF